MKHILHLIRFDAAALKWPLLGWTALLVAEGMWFYAGPPSTGRAVMPLVYVLVNAPIVIRALLTALLVAQLVQKDPMVGTSAFWQARPVSRGALLTSKVLSAFLWFVALPVAWTIGVLMLLGMAIGDAANAGWMVAEVQTLIVVVSMAAAAVSTNLVYFTLAMAGSLTASGLVGRAVGSAVMKTWPALKIPVLADAWYIVAPFIIAAVFLAVVHHYLTLKTRRTWQILWLVALGTSLVAGLLVPTLPAAPQMLQAGQKDAPGYSGFTLTADVASQRVDPPASGKAQGPAKLTFDLSSSGTTPNVYVSPAHVETEVEFADGTRTSWSGVPGSGPALDRDGRPTTRSAATVIASALKTPDLLVSDNVPSFLYPVSRSRTCILEMPEAEFRRHQGETVRIRSWILGWVCRIRVAAGTPLKEGNRLRIARGVASISRIRRDPAGLSMDVRYTYAPAASDASDWMSLPHWRQSVLRNSARRQSIVMGVSASEGPSVTLFGPRGATTNRDTEGYRQENPGSRSFSIDANWLDGAELVRVEAWQLGLLRGTLVIDSFVLGAVAK